jgi:hypothetical protein
MKYFRFLPVFLFFFLFAFIRQAQAAQPGASLSFSPASESVMVGESFEVDVVLDTGGLETDGVDFLISYDETKLEAKNAVLGDLYDNKINEDVSQPGKIVLQAVSDVGSSFVGTGEVATINFKAIAGGLAQVSFEMMGESTTDCNVNSEGEDILASVSNGAYTILPMGVGGDGDATASGTPTPTSTGTLTPTPTVPETGFLGPTVVGLSFGGLLILIALSLLIFI